MQVTKSNYRKPSGAVAPSQLVGDTTLCGFSTRNGVAPGPPAFFLNNQKIIRRSRKEQKLHNRVEELHGRAKKMVARASVITSLSNSRQDALKIASDASAGAQSLLEHLYQADKIRKGMKGHRKESVLEVSEVNALLNVVENSTASHLRRVSQRPPAADGAEAWGPPPALLSGRRPSLSCTIHVKGGDRVKAPPKLEERRISFGRHTKLGYGGREISEVGEGGRKLSKQERADALQDMKKLHNAQIQNFHARRSHIEDKVNRYREDAHDRMSFVERAGNYEEKQVNEKKPRNSKTS